MGEETESYLIRILQGTTLHREETSHSPRWTYTAAMRQTDNITGDYRIEIAQLSARIGPGHRTALSISP